MKRKKILFLGGAFSQIPAIEYARQKNLYVITADYLPNNPGHRISNEYYNISTTDKDSILELAKYLKIDAISAYASDPAAPTAAFVAEKLNLVGSPYVSVEILSNKHLFRTFLKTHGFCVPWFIYGSRIEDFKGKYSGGKAILKPVDSSGSKGISTINNIGELTKNFEISKSYSRTNRVILEEYINRQGPQIHGEGFVLNGEIIFMLLGDQVFSKVNNLVPYSTIVPSVFHLDIMDKVHEVVRKAIKKVGFKTGGINVEVIRSYKNEIYILEIGARNGGNYMPQLIKCASKFDLAKTNVDVLVDDFSTINYFNNRISSHGQIILHSGLDGSFKKLNIPVELENNVREKHIYYKTGDSVQKYKSSKDVIGVLIVELPNIKTVYKYQKSLKNWDWILVE